MKDQLDQAKTPTRRERWIGLGIKAAAAFGALAAGIAALVEAF